MHITNVKYWRKSNLDNPPNIDKTYGYPGLNTRRRIYVEHWNFLNVGEDGRRGGVDPELVYQYLTGERGFETFLCSMDFIGFFYSRTG